MTLSFVGGPGEIVATDNGDATDFNIFLSCDRKAFNGLVLIFIKAKRGQTSPVVITSEYDGQSAVTCVLLRQDNKAKILFDESMKGQAARIS